MKETTYAFKTNVDFLQQCELVLDAAPPAELLQFEKGSILKRIGYQAKHTMKVEVPFTRLLQISQLEQEPVWWRKSRVDHLTIDLQSAAEGVLPLRIPMGPAGSGKPQYLTMGTGMANHGIIVGRTGSGKSNLLHILITTACLQYSPDELELYLIDFKQGVEFKCYADAALPHARVIAIESEREFGLSILRKLDKRMVELRDIFQGNTGREGELDDDAYNISVYRQKTGERLPRTLLIVDEYQEFFVQDDPLANEARLLLDRLARQGRAFGIHVLLGTQSLGSSFSLPRNTLEQMGVRIALQCSEADSRLILADDNPAARLLSRPGEAIYNDMNGRIEGNQEFQVALFSDDDRKAFLQRIRDHFEAKMDDEAQRKYGRPIIFRGHLPARIDDCAPLTKALSHPTQTIGRKGAETWIGDPVSIEDPVAVRFVRQAGSNLLVVARDEDQGLGVLSSALLGLLTHCAPDACRFMVADFSTTDCPWGEQVQSISDAVAHDIEYGGPRALAGMLQKLTTELNTRTADVGRKHPEIFFLVQGLHRAKDLRKEDGGFTLESFDKSASSPVDDFQRILREGAELGIHTLAWSDTYQNASRVLGRKGLNEFALRTAGPMSQEDSSYLLDNAAAAKLDRPHRMIFYDEDKPGVLVKFRPYSLPDPSWLTKFLTKLSARA